MQFTTARFALAIGVVTAFVAASLHGAPETRPATAPAKPVVARPTALRPGEKPPVQLAIAQLLQEYQKAMADVKKNGLPKPPPPDPNKHGPVTPVLEPGLRDHCDFFKKETSLSVTPEAIVAALEKSISSDVRADAYVKWQLLSGVPDKFPKELLPRVYRIYRAAARPAPHPGLNRADLDRVLYRVGIRNQDAEPEVNAEYGNVITRYLMAIDPILSYRDEIYARLPAGYDAFLAGLEDVYTRVSQGAPANVMWTTMSAQIRTWALDSKESRQMRDIATVLGRVQEAVRNERNRPYVRVTYTKTDKTEGLKWTAEGAISQDRSLEETAQYLYTQAENPGGGGLGFKEIKEKK